MAHTQATLVASVATQYAADEISEGSSQANGAKGNLKEPKGAKKEAKRSQKEPKSKRSQKEPKEANNSQRPKNGTKGPRRSHLDQREL